jgi:hypothetical protein
VTRPKPKPKKPVEWDEELRERLRHYIYGEVTKPDGTVVPITPARDVAPLMRILIEMERSEDKPKALSRIDQLEARRKARGAG